jgi:23S rRNA pseudouridine1911/1915/1917 synthase
VAHPIHGEAFAATEHGKPSETRFRVLERDAGSGTSLLLADLVTGRPHQIRVHAAAAGHPLAGDRFFARGGVPALSDARLGDGGYRLHAWAVRVRLPGGRGDLDVVCAPPEGFLAPAFDMPPPSLVAGALAHGAPDDPAAAPSFGAPASSPQVSAPASPGAA